MNIVNIAHRLACGIVNVFQILADIGRVNELWRHYAVILVENKRGCA